MKYLGGKYRLSKPISSYLNSVLVPDQGYWEPFVGSAWIINGIRAKRRYASDINYYLIQMWRALQDGWIPPDTVTEDEYLHIKENMDAYPPQLVAFVGFSSSWGGKWFGGYARDGNDRNYTSEGKRGLLKKTRNLTGVNFFHADFVDAEPPEDAMLIYCDPPYEGMTKYDYHPEFDHGVFWDRVRKLDDTGHTVVVSEYNAPGDFVIVKKMDTITDIRTTDGRVPRKECLFSTRPLGPDVRQLTIKL